VARAFTLLETTAAILILGLIATAVSLSLHGRYASVRAGDVLEQIQFLDQTTRAVAQRSGAPVKLRLDLDRQCIERIEGDSDDQVLVLYRIPSRFKIDVVLSDGQESRRGRVQIAFNAEGLSGTYALCLAAEKDSSRRWLAVAGLSGQATVLADRKEVDALFKTLAGVAEATEPHPFEKVFVQ